MLNDRFGIMHSRFSTAAAGVCLCLLMGCQEGPIARGDAPAPAAATAPAVPAQGDPVELSLKQGYTLPGGDPQKPDITLGVIPTRPWSAQTWLNPVTNGIEQRIKPAILHPIPTLRAFSVLLFNEQPDLSKVGMETLNQATAEKELNEQTKFALIATNRGDAFLLSFEKVELPQDRENDWRIRLTAQKVTLVDHVPDPVADRGRAVETHEPLPLTGRLIFGRLAEDWETATLYSLDLSKSATTTKDAAAKNAADQRKELAKGNMLRAAPNGTIGRRSDVTTITLTDQDGRAAGTVKLETTIDDWNISPDGKRIVVVTDRKSKTPTDDVERMWETVAAVYEADGTFVGEIVGYDDPAFLPDGRLVVTGKGIRPGLFISDPKTGKTTPIRIAEDNSESPQTPEAKAPEPTQTTATPASPRTPAVSSDGKRLAYVDGASAYVVGIDGSNPTPVWNNPGHEPQQRPVFSPDGRYVALLNMPPSGFSGPGQIVIVDPEKQLRQSVGEPDMAYSHLPLLWVP